MTESEILEGNKLIAEFDGAIVDMESVSNVWYYRHYIKSETQNSGYIGKCNGITCAVKQVGSETFLEINNLKYHSSWDWLMPVWNKCTKIGLWMMTNGYEKLWIEKSKEIEDAIIREHDCQKASIKIAHLINWYNEIK